jgi:hypothetical protein
LIRELCFEEGSIRIDYWGCYAEIFVSGPPWSRISLTLSFGGSSDAGILRVAQNDGAGILERGRWYTSGVSG